jgi:hypothetical protein
MADWHLATASSKWKRVATKEGSYTYSAKGGRCVGVYTPTPLDPKCTPTGPHGFLGNLLTKLHPGPLKFDPTALYVPI